MFESSGSGKQVVTLENGNTYTLSNQESHVKTNVNKRYPTTTINSKFKLVTVRRLTNLSTEEVNRRLEASYKQLEAAALRKGLPVPYPLKQVTVDEVANTYGVYVDEDLGNSAPVYVFTTDTTKVKAFITTSGAGRNDWSVHIAHSLEKTKNPDGTYLNKWRLVTIDSSDTGYIFYVLEDTGTHKSFSFNFDLDSLHYLGGGTWTAMSVDREDRLPIYALAPANSDRYIKVGNVFASFGETRARSLVAYSMTPSYVFTWQRGRLQLNYRTRNAAQTLDRNSLTKDGVIKFTREHEYNLEIPLRLENTQATNNIRPITISEYSQGKATYVGNTNCPSISSQYQNPDYGTDKKRLSISGILMKTNIMRPLVLNEATLTGRKLSKCPLNYTGIICASANASFLLKHDIGEGSGEFNHPYELKRSAGKRGFQYGEDYKLWWVYGRVIDFYEYGDTNRYKRLKNPGFDANGIRLPDKVKIGSMFDLGNLIKSNKPNAVETTWDALPNPPTGFFGVEEGTLSFYISYLNPPLIGHSGVYYYHINPDIVGVGGGDFELNDNGVAAEQRLNQNVLKNLYSQMLGGLGGGGLSSLNIGNITIAASDVESIIVRDPNTTQNAALRARPETFPAGYFDTDLYTFVLDTNNQGFISIYDLNGSIQNTYPIN